LSSDILWHDGYTKKVTLLPKEIEWQFHSSRDMNRNCAMPDGKRSVTPPSHYSNSHCDSLNTLDNFFYPLRSDRNSVSMRCFVFQWRDSSFQIFRAEKCLIQTNDGKFSQSIEIECITHRNLGILVSFSSFINQLIVHSSSLDLLWSFENAWANQSHSTDKSLSFILSFLKFDIQIKPRALHIVIGIRVSRWLRYRNFYVTKSSLSLLACANETGLMSFHWKELSKMVQLHDKQFKGADSHWLSRNCRLMTGPGRVKSVS
jgi:hypothetical protein